MKKDRPTFIGIGVQKSATTWLAHMLRKHPDVYIPPAKEIHFFDRNPKYSSPNYLNYNSIWDKLIKKELFSFHFWGILAGIKWLFNGKPAKFIWRLKFHLNNSPGLGWYQSLFKTSSDALTLKNIS